jgi:hypothetical protein
MPHTPQYVNDSITMRIGTYVRPFVMLAILLATTTQAAARDNPAAATFSAIRDSDLRLAALGYRLALANTALCDARQPGTGLVLHTIGTYKPAMRRLFRTYFGLVGSVGVEAVVPASPAARAGVQPDDSLISINQWPVAVSDDGRANVTPLVSLFDRLAALPPARLIVLGLMRAGRPLTLTITPQPICRVRFELLISSQRDASSDGQMVQVSSKFLADLADPYLAVVIAHEFAHNILRHPQRLAAAKVSGGILAGLGRNVAYFRQTETQADILSVALLANAGFDPMLPAQFWRGFGASHFSGVFMDRSHPTPQARAATTARAAASLASHPERPIIPETLSTRDTPLDGDWQSILVDK